MARCVLVADHRCWVEPCVLSPEMGKIFPKATVVVGQPMEPVGISGSLGNGKGKDLKQWVLQELFPSLFFYTNDIFFLISAFLQVDFIAYAITAIMKLAVGFALLFLFVFVLYVTLGKSLWTAPWFLVESYFGFHVKTKPCEQWESGLCATD